jgi:dUTP pyrophosphatase
MRSSEYIIEEFINNHDNFLNRVGKVAVLKLVVNSDDSSLVELYKQHIENHNRGIINDVFPNSGFDLFIPNNVVFNEPIKSKFIDLKVKAEMVYIDKKMNSHETCAYTVHPRSSMSKTPLMLANHTGIIDAGYRGNLIGAVRWLQNNDSNRENNNESNHEYILEKHTRLLQICHPTLCPIFVYLVEEQDLTTTERGTGGFGSTGITGLTNQLR